MDKPTNTKTVVGGGAGGALGALVVIMTPKVSTLVWEAGEAAIVTAALGILFSWLARYLPQPGG